MIESRISGLAGQVAHTGEWGNLAEREDLEDVSVDGRVTLN